MQPKIYPVNDHDIDTKAIDQDALYVIQKLRQAGYPAYLVGGSVRDLILKKRPKDYDISTSARPEEIKQVFGKRCLLIGRRFRLAHIRFGHKIIEVSTFRSGENDSDLILNDNQWGTPEEDVLRRDFTVNGLFYDPTTHTVIDYVGGWDDIHANVLRSIGHPVVRFKQDPVRMIRLLKFRARFGFSIADDCQKALEICLEEIVKSSPARVLEEFFRMLESGAAEPFLRLLCENGLLELLFPCLCHFLVGPYGDKIYRLLVAADQINRQYMPKTLDRAVLTSCLLFPILEREITKQYLNEGQVPHFGDIMIVTGALIKAVVTSSFSHFPRRMAATMSYILTMQYRLTPPATSKKHARPKLFSSKEFEFALHLLKLRSLIDKEAVDPYNHWKNLFMQHHRQQDKRHHNAPPPSQRKPRTVDQNNAAS